jgi:hypothetical protein
VFYFRGLIPEFTHFRAAPDLRRKLTLALAFTAFGLVAGASGVALLVAEDDSDPRSAFALARLPSPAEEQATTITTIEMPATPVAQAVLPPQVAKVETLKPCGRSASGAREADCDPGASRKPEVVLAVTAPPAAGDAPSGQSSEPAEAAPRPAALVANAPPPLEEGTVVPVNATAPAPAAEAVAPARPAATPRRTAHNQARRAPHYQQYSVWPFGGNGRRGGFRLFW